VYRDRLKGEGGLEERQRERVFGKTKKRNNMDRSPEDKSPEGCIKDKPRYVGEGGGKRALIWIRGKMLFVNVIFFLHTLKSSLLLWVQRVTKRAEK